MPMSVVERLSRGESACPVGMKDAFPFQEALRPLFSRVGCNMTLFQLTLNQAKVDLTLNRRIGTEEAIVISQRK
jgi:hypothetical protein